MVSLAIGADPFPCLLLGLSAHGNWHVLCLLDGNEMYLSPRHWERDVASFPIGTRLA